MFSICLKAIFESLIFLIEPGFKAFAKLEEMGSVGIIARDKRDTMSTKNLLAQHFAVFENRVEVFDGAFGVKFLPGNFGDPFQNVPRDDWIELLMDLKTGNTVVFNQQRVSNDSGH